jgi:hypothetical protein
MLANGNETFQPLRIGLFGAGSRGVQCLAALGNDPRFVVECFFDNSPAKWGTELEGLPIRQATSEACAALDAVVIASQYAREILAQLSGLGYTRVALSPTHLVRRFSRDGGARTATEPPHPAAVRRLEDDLIARTPLHVSTLADRIDREPDPPPARGVGWVNETACTICCNNYFAYALVLARSFLRHHPAGRFFIGLADRPSSGVTCPLDPRITVIAAEDLGIPAFGAFAFKYDVLELNTAIKPFLLEHLFQHEGVRRILYLDPDILVLDSLAPLFDKLADVPMLLTPHLTRPYADDLHPREVDIMRAGTYNLGFIGLAAHDQTWAFLSWWQQRLYNNGCTREVEKGYFTDQKWIDLVPSFFPAHAVLRAPGYNAAYWNLHERTIGFADGRFVANGEPLRFFHFSGVEILDIESVSKHQNRFTLPAIGALRDLFELYRLLLVRHGHLTLRSTPYTYGRFDNGVRVPDIVRIVYRESALTGVYPHPLTTGASPSFYDWLRAPSRPGLPLTNLQATLHARMPDLRAAYPDVYGASLVGFLLHMISASELYGLPTELSGDTTEVTNHLAERPTPVLTNVARVSGRSTARRAGTDTTSPAKPPEAVRALAEPGDEAHQVMSQSVAVAVREAASRSRVTSDLLVGPVELELPRRSSAGQQASVAYWCWDELWDRDSIGVACRPSTSSSGWTPREIWVPSTYALEGLSRMTTLPVVKVPPPIGLVEPSKATRETFMLPEGRFLLASLVEPGSGGDAADAIQTARAFCLASKHEEFAARAALALWVAPSLLTPDVRRALHDAAGHAPGFHVIERPLAPADRVQLLRLADAYVSLQAWQAFDLWLAYAAWHGTPAIAAARGGGMDCATINNSLLVDLVSGGSTPHTRPAKVADERHAAALMTHALGSPVERRHRGTRAREDARARYRLDAIASTIQGRLEQLGAIAS